MNNETLEEYGDEEYYEPELSNREQALLLIGEENLLAQLLAIRGLIKRNEEIDEAVIQEIKRLEERARDYEHQFAIESYLEDYVFELNFQDAAHSMAALGMLAPFIESLFVAVFRGIKNAEQGIEKFPKHDDRTKACRNEFWNPHFVFKNADRRRDLVGGIVQLSRSIGLVDHMPGDYELTLSALFAYRNKMFHHGFEWPLEERLNFEKRIESSGWPDGWFTVSRYGDDPWIFFISTEFIQRCLTTIDEILEGVGAFLRQELD